MPGGRSKADLSCKIDRLKLLQALVAAMPATAEWGSRGDRGEDIIQVVFEQEVDAVRLGGREVAPAPPAEVEGQA